MISVSCWWPNRWQPPLVVAARQLEERRVQPHDANSPPVEFERRREIARQGAGLHVAGPVGRLLPPLAIGREGVIDHAAIAACGLIPEFLLLYSLKTAVFQQDIDRRIVFKRIRAIQIVIPRNREKHGVSRSQLAKLLPQGIEHLSLHLLELGALSRLHEVAGEENGGPWAALLVQGAETFEKRLA